MGTEHTDKWWTNDGKMMENWWTNDEQLKITWYFTTVCSCVIFYLTSCKSSLSNREMFQTGRAQEEPSFLCPCSRLLRRHLWQLLQLSAPRNEDLSGMAQFRLNQENPGSLKSLYRSYNIRWPEHQPHCQIASNCHPLATEVLCRRSPNICPQGRRGEEKWLQIPWMYIPATK